MTARSRTLQALTDPHSSYRSWKRHRRRRVDKKRRARWYRESRLAWKWLHGMHDWAVRKVQVDADMEMFGAKKGSADGTGGDVSL